MSYMTFELQDFDDERLTKQFAAIRDAFYRLTHPSATTDVDLSVTSITGSGVLPSGWNLTTKAGVPDETDLEVVNTLCLDTTNSDLYINIGDAENPVWMKITRETPA
jgi:hypothetical protein